MPIVAVVDDEKDILDLVCLHLEKNGFKAKPFLCVKDFFEFLDQALPDIVLLDIMLPDMDGIDVLKSLRSKDKSAHLPIILLTARTDEMDRVLGLELGADDYITKPFSTRELVARVKAVLRRGSEKHKNSDVLELGDLRMDRERFEAFIGDEKIGLTTSEFRILWLFAANPGRVFTREQILDELWGDHKAVLDRTVDVHIRNIRAKLGNLGGFIKNVRGVGYKIETDV